MESHATEANAVPLGFDWWSTALGYQTDLKNRRPLLYCRRVAENIDRLLFEFWSEMSTSGGDIDRRATGDDNSSEDPDYNVWGGWGTSTTVSPITDAGALSQTASCASAPKALPSTSTTAPPSPKLTAFTDASALSGAALPPLHDDDGWKQLLGSSTVSPNSSSTTPFITVVHAQRSRRSRAKSATIAPSSAPPIAPSSAPPIASDDAYVVSSSSASDCASASPSAPRERSRSRRRTHSSSSASPRSRTRPVESASSSNLIVDQLLSEHAANRRLAKASLQLPRPPSVPPSSLTMATHALHTAIGNAVTTHATAQPKSGGQRINLSQPKWAPPPQRPPSRTFPAGGQLPDHHERCACVFCAQERAHRS